MKVSKYSSSKRTDEAIRRAFAELLSERKSINKISVAELSERANITRGTFYAHYDNIYDVAADLEDGITNAVFQGGDGIETIEDVDDRFKEIFKFLRENEELYRILFNSDSSIMFANKLDEMIRNALTRELKKRGISSPKLELDAAFFIDGAVYMLIRYFRGGMNMSLSDIEWYLRQKANELFKANLTMK